MSYWNYRVVEKALSKYEHDTDDSCDYEASSVCLKVKSFNLVKERQ